MDDHFAVHSILVRRSRKDLYSWDELWAVRYYQVQGVVKACRFLNEQFQTLVVQHGDELVMKSWAGRFRFQGHQFPVPAGEVEVTASEDVSVGDSCSLSKRGVKP